MKMSMEESKCQLFNQLDNFEKEGVISKLEWLTANDENVCAECAKRNRKIYSIPAARKLLNSDFCSSKWCRCCFVATED
jgi:hypothetical protein